MSLRFKSKELIRPQPATWVQETFQGRRHTMAIGFHDVRTGGLFPLYLEHRDRVVRLSEDPSQLIVSFREPDRLQIQSVAPPTAQRRLTTNRESSQQVSLYLDRSEGLAPQVLSVEFGYFSGVQSWMPIIVPMLFFLLGNLAAVSVRFVAERISRRLSGRVQFGPSKAPAPRESGVIVPREKLAAIVPGQTTYEQLTKLLGPVPEEHERLDGAGRRTLVYRGRRLVPRFKRRFGWVTTVAHWDVEDHEVEIELERDRVHDVHARVRRSRAATPDAPGNSR